MSDAPCWKRSEALLQRRSPEGLLILPPGSSEVTVLSGTALSLWEVLAEPRTLDEVVDVLAGWYRAEPDEIAADVELAIRDLATRGLVRAA